MVGSLTGAVSSQRVTEEHEGALITVGNREVSVCLLYTSPSPRDYAASRMPSSA